MSIWNKVLIGLVFLGSVAFFYFSLRTLKTLDYWQHVAEGREFYLDVRQQYSETRQDGGELRAARGEPGEQTPDDRELRNIRDEGKFDRKTAEDGLEVVEEEAVGIETLRVLLEAATDERGPVWYNCRPNGANGQYQVNVASGMVAAMQLYVFEERVIGAGAYLGEFRVQQVDPPEGGPQTVTLVPSLATSPEELARIDRSAADLNTPWSLYARMPVDKRETLRDVLDEAQAAAETALGITPAENDEDKIPNLPDERVIERVVETVSQALNVSPQDVREHLLDGRKMKETDLEKYALQGKLLPLDESEEAAVYTYLDENGTELESRIEMVEYVVDKSGNRTKVVPGAAPIVPTEEKYIVEIPEGYWVKPAGADGNAEDERVDGETVVLRLATGNDPGVYFRPLTDYRVICHGFYQRRIDLADQIEAAKRELAIVQQAQQTAEANAVFRKAELDEARTALAAVIEERDAIEVHGKALKAEIDKRNSEIDQLLLYNQAVAAQIAKIQSDAAKAINARTLGMVQAGAGGTN